MSRTQTAHIHTTEAPEPVGAYSQGVAANGFVFTAGQVGIDAAGNLAGTDIVTQANQTFRNITAILAAAGTTPANLIKTTVYLKNTDDFKTVNELYAAWVGSPAPARTTIAVAWLALGALIEVECVAAIPQAPEPSR